MNKSLEIKTIGLESTIGDVFSEIHENIAYLFYQRLYLKFDKI